MVAQSIEGVGVIVNYRLNGMFEFSESTCLAVSCFQSRLKLGVRSMCSIILVEIPHERFIVLTTVEDAMDLNGFLIDGEGDDYATTKTDSAQSRPQVISSKADHGKLSETVTVVEDR